LLRNILNNFIQNPSQAEYESGWGIKFDNGNQMTLANYPSNGARTFLTSAPNSNQLSIFPILKYVVFIKILLLHNIQLVFVVLEKELENGLIILSN
jgi:hypothetical protein